MSWLEDLLSRLNGQSSNGDDGGGLMTDEGRESLFVNGGYDTQWEHWKQMNRA